MKEEIYFRTAGLTVGYQGVPLIRDICIQMKKRRNSDADRAKWSW